MARYALINKENKVVNIIVWNEDAWQPPYDHYVVESSVADIDDRYDESLKVFIKSSQVNYGNE